MEGHVWVLRGMLTLQMLTQPRSLKVLYLILRPELSRSLYRGPHQQTRFLFKTEGTGQIQFSTLHLTQTCPWWMRKAVSPAAWGLSGTCNDPGETLGHKYFRAEPLPRGRLAAVLGTAPLVTTAQVYGCTGGGRARGGGLLCSSSSLGKAETPSRVGEPGRSRQRGVSPGSLS